MEKKELLEYECPFIAEFISNNRLQDLIAKYLVWKVNKKWKRYENRLARREYFKDRLKPNNK